MIWSPSVDLELYYDNGIGPGQGFVEICALVSARGFKPIPPGELLEHFSLILDCSGSMGEEGRLDAAKLAAYRFIDLLQPHESFSVVAFSDTARLVYSSQQADRSQKAAAKTQILALQPDGNTNFAAGLSLAYSTFAGSGAERGQGILLSDGEKNRGNLDEALAMLRLERRAGYLFPVSCRRIGHGNRVVFLRQICDATLGGVVVVLPDHDKLADDFTDWMSAIRSCGTTMRLVYEPDEEATLAQIAQVNPSVVQLTDLLTSDGQRQLIHLGPKADGVMEFYLRVALGKKQVAESGTTRLGLVSVQYEYGGQVLEAPRNGSVTEPAAVLVQFDPDKPAPQLPEPVDVAKKRIAYASEVDEGLAAYVDGRDHDARSHLGTAASIAYSLRERDPNKLRDLESVVEIDDAARGRVRLKRKSEVGDRSMDLDSRSTMSSW